VRQSSLKNQVDTARARVKSKLGFRALLPRTAIAVYLHQPTMTYILSAAFSFGRLALRDQILEVTGGASVDDFFKTAESNYHVAVE
jgi:hypothetical protein